MLQQKNWTAIYEQLAQGLPNGVLEPDALEELAQAAYLTGRDAASYQAMEDAHQNYLQQKKINRAARCAFWLGLMFINAGEKAKASGWMGRGKRLLADPAIPASAEHGLFIVPVALETLASGDAARALTLFEQAMAIGKQFSDIDLIVLGRLGQGQAMTRLGNVSKGLRLLDEAMITVDADEVFPVIRGIVYCAVIETCRRCWDIRRAQEWTSTLIQWCDAQPDIVPFKGQCLVRKAEVMQLHGEWNKALEEADVACQLLTRHKGEPAAGEAYYRKAELYRLLGNYNAAEEEYRSAAIWGKVPQPGMALMRLAQGEHDAAATAIRNALTDTSDPRKRAELLPAAVSILLASKQADEALDACNELQRIAEAFDAAYLHGISLHCQAAVLIEQGEVQQALTNLNKAFRIWNALHLPYETALTRELRGLTYRELNDKDNADLDWAAAKWIVEQLHAGPDRERIDRLLKGKKIHPNHGLTLREVQVLRLVADGQTNKNIGNDLFISERTVDRHVSNIFNKLGVSSRAAATSLAIKNKILDEPD